MKNMQSQLPIEDHRADLTESGPPRQTTLITDGMNDKPLSEMKSQSNDSNDDAFFADLPPEISTGEAAKLLGVDARTIGKYLRSGLLEWRSTAPPSSTTPTYRFRLSSVMALKTKALTRLKQ